MFDKLFSLVGISTMRTIIGRIEDILSIIENEESKDKNLKNAAIDTIIQILQQHKDPQ
jgi:hypothetical protein